MKALSPMLTLLLWLSPAAAESLDWAARTNHWAFQPIRRVHPPAVKNQAWVRNAIDHFVLARIERAGLEPSPEADRYTLIRRVYLDLIGLPPTIEEVDAFVADRRPGAFERVVRGLLDSPHYGEKWGRHWLDQARYADSNGYTIDGPRVMWPYRDWVIDAINRDLPFDRFTIEQLAGDLLPEPSLSQLIATGFHRNTLINQEGGTDDEQFRVESVVDRVNTTGTVWLGLTLGCAQCHTHKFDPVTIEEYYRFYAFFNSTEDKNNTGPTARVRPPGHAERLREVDRQLATARAALTRYDRQPARSQADWEGELARLDPAADPWRRLTPVEFFTRGKADIRQLEDGSLFVGPGRPPHDVYTVVLRPGTERLTALRLEVIPDPRLPKNGPGLAGNGNFVLTQFEAEIDGRKVKFHKAVADHAQPGFPIANTLDGSNATGWAINVRRGSGQKMNTNHWAVFFPEAPIAVSGKRLTIRLHHDSPRNRGYLIGRFAISAASQPESLLTLNNARDLVAAVKTPPDRRDKKQRALLLAEFRNQDPQRRPLARAVERLENERARLEKEGATTMVMRELKQPRETHVQIRGDFLRKGQRVTPGVPAFLPGLPPGTKGNRLDLARWLVDPDNPLTARVTVNRVWMRYFGTGLVETENDFGTQGTPPTHPKLLDWLASEFVRQGWSMKRLHELIVTSATYRQSSHRADLRTDPLNHLLARQNRLRVDAELVRDMALAVSGRLAPQLGGPSVHPPQPDGVYNFTQNRKKWDVVEGPQKYRRTMYTFFYRSAPFPLLTTFDVPDLSATCTARPRSNTPLQALALANDEGIFEMAQALAASVLGERASDDAARLTRLFRRCLTRPPTSWELARLGAYLQSQRGQFAADETAARDVSPKRRPENISASECAAWVMLARAVMNLDEFITRE